MFLARLSIQIWGVVLWLFPETKSGKAILAGRSWTLEAHLGLRLWRSQPVALSNFGIPNALRYGDGSKPINYMKNYDRALGDEPDDQRFWGSGYQRFDQPYAAVRSNSGMQCWWTAATKRCNSRDPGPTAQVPMEAANMWGILQLKIFPRMPEVVSWV